MTHVCPLLPDNHAPKNFSFFKLSLKHIKFLLLVRKLSFKGMAERQLCALVLTPARPGCPGSTELSTCLPVPPTEQGRWRSDLGDVWRKENISKFGSADATLFAPVSALPDATETAVLSFLRIFDMTCIPHPLLTRAIQWQFTNLIELQEFDFFNVRGHFLVVIITVERIMCFAAFLCGHHITLFGESCSTVALHVLHFPPFKGLVAWTTHPGIISKKGHLCDRIMVKMHPEFGNLKNNLSEKIWNVYTH